MNFLQNRNRLTDLENKLVVSKGDSRGCGEITQGFGINISVISYAFIFLCLTYFTWYDNIQVHPYCF